VNTGPAFFPRLRLTATDRRSQILASALEVFAELGFHGARTRDLAEKAGVSEALLFRHFPTKEDLIRAIFESLGFEQRIELMEERFSKLPPRDALLSLAEFSLTALREEPRVFRVVFFGVLEMPELAGEFYRKFLSRLLALETRLFRLAFAERGAKRAARDAAIAARSFHGSLLFYQITGAVVRIEPLPRDSKARAEAIVNLYLPEDAA
jgi:AcrR family transcriptional regulator